MNRIRIAALLVVAVAFTVPSSASAVGHVIVKYRTGASVGKRRLSIQAVGGAVVGAIRAQGTKLIAVAGEPARAAARMAREPGVAWAEPDVKLFTLAPPDDPLLAQLGGLGLMHAQAAWDALGMSASDP